MNILFIYKIIYLLTKKNKMLSCGQADYIWMGASMTCQTGWLSVVSGFIPVMQRRSVVDRPCFLLFRASIAPPPIATPESELLLLFECISSFAAFSC